MTKVEIMWDRDQVSWVWRMIDDDGLYNSKKLNINLPKTTDPNVVLRASLAYLPAATTYEVCENGKPILTIGRN